MVRAGRLVTLPAVPIPFLASTPLLEGAWIDLTVLKLAEFGAILADRGRGLRGSGDAHPLASEEFVTTDARGGQVPIDESTWREADKSAGARVGRYRGGRRRFGGRTYVSSPSTRDGALARSAAASRPRPRPASSSPTGTTG